MLLRDYLYLVNTMKSTEDYSRIIAGTMTWGSWGKQLNTKEMVELMQECFEMGICTFDHADIYGDYTNEHDFGKALASSSLDRESIQLITKCGIQMTSGRDNRVKHYQYDSEYIIWSAERSLKQLKTEYLDLFLLHRPSPLMHPEAIAKAVEKLKADGKIRAFGVSNFTPSQITLLDTKTRIEANQVEFSLSHTNPMYDGTFDDCIINNRFAMAWSPLGTFFREKSKRNSAIGKVLSGLKKKYDVDENQLLLAFLLKHPAKVYPVVGTTQKKRLKAALKAVKIDLELQDWFVLLEAAQGQEVP